MHFLRRGSGEAILFIHGMPTNNHLWSGVVDHLCRDFTCLAVDLPGMGESPLEKYTDNYLQKWAERIESIRNRYRIRSWHIVGHDAGSAVAVQYAHTYKHRVRRLALLSPALFPDLRPYYLLELLRRPVVGEVLAPLVNCVFWNIAMRRAAQNEEGVSGPTHAVFQKPFCGMGGSWKFMRTMRWGSPRDVLADIPNFLPKLDVPTLLVHGSQDPVIPPAFVNRAKSLFPNARIVEMECGHFIPLNRPAALAGHLHDFLQETGTVRTNSAIRTQRPRAKKPIDPIA